MKWLLWGLLPLVSACLALALGMPELSLAEAFSDSNSWQYTALVKLQLPRVCLGLAVGATLALGGVMLQGLLRNPLCEPYLLGVSGGAASGVALTTLLSGILGVTLPIIAPLGGFLGAAFALLLVVGLSGRRAEPLKMVLIGVVVNALAGALVMVLNALGDAASVQRTLIRLMGSLSPDLTRPYLLWIVVVLCVVALVWGLKQGRALDVMTLGEEGAQSVGLDVSKTRRTLLLGLSIPIGAIVALSGMIGFVGLIAPHAARSFVGAKHRPLMWVSACLGASGLVLADATTSALSPLLGTELPVGVLTALIGGPLFLWQLSKGARA